MNITKHASRILQLFHSAGHYAFVVGGCVRDALMGAQLNDIDITTSATPSEMVKLFEDNDIKFIETGLKHGTLTAVIEQEPFEVTTFRSDGEYDDFRHPNGVEFVSDIETDLARRDFTMNAIAYNDEQGFIDPFSGRQDINNKIIRAVGNAKTRFNEDALRIMRGIRFASVFGFSLENETKTAAIDNKMLLQNVSSERVYAELSKLLMGDYVFDIMTEYKDVLGVIVPQLKPSFDCKQNNPWHVYDVYTHTAKAVSCAPKDLVLRLVMLFHDVGKPSCKTTDEKGIDHFYGHPKVSVEMAEKALRRLRVPNDVLERVLILVQCHDERIISDEKNIKKWLSKYGVDVVKELILVKKADMMAQNRQKTDEELLELEKTQKMIFEILQRGDVFDVSDLAVNGYDLIELGFKGAEIGGKLNELLEMVINEEVENEKIALIGKLK